MEQLITPLLASLFSVLVLGTVIMRQRIAYWREKASEALFERDDLMQRALNAEKEAAAGRDEMVRWQALLNSLQQRPIIAALNDQQAAALVTSIQLFVQQSLHGPN